MSSLIDSIHSGDVAALTACLTAGHDPNTSTRLGLTALHLAAVKGEVGLVQCLLNHGGSVNIPTSWGSSALHIAAQKGAQEVVELLLSHGAEVNSRDENLDTPLHLACAEGNYAAVQALVDAGADKSLKNGAGMDAFEEAMNSDYAKEVVDALTSTVPTTSGVNACHEYAPEFEVPTNESFTSLINDLQSSTPPSQRAQSTLDSYNGTASIAQATDFSFIRKGPSEEGSFDRPSLSLSHILYNFDSGLVDANAGNSIDSSVFRETCQLYQQFNPPPPLQVPEVVVESTAGSVEVDNSLQPPTPINPPHAPPHTAPLAPPLAAPLHSIPEGEPENTGLISDVIGCLSPILESIDTGQLLQTMSAVAKALPPPWPSDSLTHEQSDREWVHETDYVLLSDTPLNVPSLRDREGSCSLVFRILHHLHGPLVLKMMINLLNESDHDTGQSGTEFLRQQFSAEHTVPVSLPAHPNIVQVVHSYHATTAPFKRYLPLLVPAGLDVAVDMASRTSFVAMPEYPVSLKSFVNAIVEEKTTAVEQTVERLEKELEVVVLLMLQCLFAVKHLKDNNIVHRDIKLDNIMLRHSGQVIVIDFGWAISLVSSDGTPSVARERNDIIAGNPDAWAPEISQTHRSFSGSEHVTFRDIYHSSDLYALGKAFISICSVFGLVEVDGKGKLLCPRKLAAVSSLPPVITLLRELVSPEPSGRATVEKAIIGLGCSLFFRNCTNPPTVLGRYLNLALSPVQLSREITDTRTLRFLPSLRLSVAKQFIASVPVNDVAEFCAR